MDDLDGALTRWFEALTFDMIEARLTQHDIPFNKIYTIEDIKSDPHFQARKAIIRLPDEELGSVSAPCIVPRVIGRELPVPRSGPALGEHNAEIYAEIGFNAEDSAALRVDGVI